MASELAYEGSDESSENELLEKSLSVWRGWSAVEDFTPVPLDLHTASSIGQYDTVRAFIQRKEDLNCKNKGGWTPLMYACYIGHDNIVNLLLEAGVDVNCKNPKGQTPLMLAASCGNESVGYFLCQHGAELEAQDRRGWTALFHATYSGHQNMVKFLLEQGCNMNAVEPTYGITPFMEAAAEGHEIIVQMFLQHRVNVNAKAFSGDMARSLALLKGHMKIVSLIDNHMIQTPVRAEPGLFAELSSSDEGVGPKRSHSLRSREKPKGPSIRDGPEGFARYLDRSRHPDPASQPPNYIPNGYVTFNEGDTSDVGQIRSRDVTSPISATDHTLDSSAGKDSLDNDEDWNSFSKTGALTIKSNSSSSGGLAAALGISREGSLDSNEEISVSPQSNSPSSPPSQRTPADGAYGSDSVHSSPDVTQQNTTQDASQYSHWTSSQSFSLFSQTDEPDALPVIPAAPVSHLGQKDNFSRTVNSVVPVGNLVSDMWALQLDQNVGSVVSCDKDCDKGVGKTLSQSANSKIPPIGTPSSVNTGLPVSSPFRTDAVAIPSGDGRPTDLSALLDQIGMSQYKKAFYQQDVDLQVFLSLTENDLKELGVLLFGHRRKMSTAIARWHSNAQLYLDNLEQVYANKLEAEMQEMAIQLHEVCVENNRLKAQVLQERELRSVTENCLMEERAAWQRTQLLIQNSHQCCHHLASIFTKLRCQQNELKRRSLPDRLLWEDSNRPAPAAPGHASPPVTSGNPSPTIDDLLWNIDYFLKHLEQNIILIKRNTDRFCGAQQLTIPHVSNSAL